MTVTRPRFTYPATNVDLYELEERLNHRLDRLERLLVQLDATLYNSPTAIASSQRKEKLACQGQEQKRKRKLKLLKLLLPASKRK